MIYNHLGEKVSDIHLGEWREGGGGGGDTLF